MKRLSRGFSLIELMLGIALLAVLLMLGVPSFRQLTQNNAVTAAHNDLVTSLQLARSEALKRNRPVTICATTDGKDCGTDADWGAGWMAFTDRDVRGEVDENDEILQFWEPQSGKLVFASEEESGFVTFEPTGMAAAEASLDVSWDGCSGKRRRHITVLVTGTVTSKADEC